MDALAVVLRRPMEVQLERLALDAPGPSDLVVEVECSGISTGTERLLWSGEMPPFPGLGYPLVPGYESVGRVREAGPESAVPVGARVFVPGARCFGPVHGLFGGAASKLVVPSGRATPVGDALGEEAILLALAATAYHAMLRAPGELVQPELIVGHGVLGRLLARISCALGGRPVVWERNPERATGADGYTVTQAQDDPRRDYASIVDVSGDPRLVDVLLGRLLRGGELVLAGFYAEPIQFAFPAAFIREARLRVAAEWTPSDLAAVLELVNAGRLSLGGLITHRRTIDGASPAIDDTYRTAFEDASCLKMLLEWKTDA